MNDSLLTRIWIFYRDGFREMTLGRTLWTIILIKLFIMFFILNLFFFQKTDQFQKERYPSLWIVLLKLVCLRIANVCFTRREYSWLYVNKKCGDIVLFPGMIPFF